MTDPDFDALAAEATEILQRYIRIDTTNPPGNEGMAADFLAGILKTEGIESRELAAVPGRTNLIATLPAEAPGPKPFLFLNHTDVVPAEAAHWQQLPFAGAVEGGFVWGR